MPKNEKKSLSAFAEKKENEQSDNFFLYKTYFYEYASICTELRRRQVLTQFRT